MNISGGGVLKNAPNPENAKKLLEFLLTKEAQEHIAVSYTHLTLPTILLV